MRASREQLGRAHSSYIPHPAYRTIELRGQANLTGRAVKMLARARNRNEVKKKDAPKRLGKTRKQSVKGGLNSSTRISDATRKWRNAVNDVRPCPPANVDGRCRHYAGRMPGPRPRQSTRRGKRLPAKKQLHPGPRRPPSTGHRKRVPENKRRETEKKRNSLRIRLQTVWKGPKARSWRL